MRRFLPLLTLIASIFFFSNVEAQLPRVAIIASDQVNTMDDVQSKLDNTGFFEIVDIIDVQSTTPDLSELQKYDAVLAYTNFNPLDPTALGNNLAARCFIAHQPRMQFAATNTPGFFP